MHKDKGFLFQVCIMALMGKELVISTTDLCQEAIIADRISKSLLFFVLWIHALTSTAWTCDVCTRNAKRETHLNHAL